jgi:Protein of unknown function (DUF3467)
MKPGSLKPRPAFRSVVSRVTLSAVMIIPTQPNFNVVNTTDYRETYANSVQVRVNVWDFFLVFGTMQQQSENQVEVRNFQGIYLSPQQAKALTAILHQNVTNYESTFGEIKLDPRVQTAPGPVH